jgi:hypothetical protein
VQEKVHLRKNLVFLVVLKKAHLEAILEVNMSKKLLLSLLFIFTLNLNAQESFLDSLKHNTSNILGEAKKTVDNIDTKKIESTVKDTYNKTTSFISSKLNENNTTKQLKEKTISSYNQLKIFTKDSIEYSKKKLDCLSK